MPFRKVGASDPEQGFTSVDPEESGFCWIEARRPATCAGTYFQYVERNFGVAQLSEGSESGLECRSLHAVRGLFSAGVAIDALTFAVWHRRCQRTFAPVAGCFALVVTRVSSRRRLCFEQGANRCGHFA